MAGHQATNEPVADSEENNKIDVKRGNSAFAVEFMKTKGIFMA